MQLLDTTIPPLPTSLHRRQIASALVIPMSSTDVVHIDIRVEPHLPINGQIDIGGSTHFVREYVVGSPFQAHPRLPSPTS